MRLYWDIETSPKAGSPADYIDKVKAPASYKKQESIDKWLADNAEKASEDLHRKTSLNPEDGSILCIAYAIDDKPVEVLTVAETFKDLSEAEVLVDFFNMIDDLSDVEFIGHNLKGFDLPFVIKRSMILGYTPPPKLVDAWSKRYSENVFDTMERWASWGKFIGQTRLSEVLKIDQPEQEMSGSEVYDYIYDGRVDEVAAYCVSDVELVRAIHRKMTWRK